MKLIVKNEKNLYSPSHRRERSEKSGEPETRRGFLEHITHGEMNPCNAPDRSLSEVTLFVDSKFSFYKRQMRHFSGQQASPRELRNAKSKTYSSKRKFTLIQTEEYEQNF